MSSPNRAQLDALVDTPGVRAFFTDLFARAQLELTDTGERFTILQQGDAMRVVEGFDDAEANLVIPLESQHLANLRGYFADGEADETERYAIVRFLLRPCLMAALKMPILQHEMLLSILKVDDVWQQALLDPSGQEDLCLTIQKEGGEWAVAEGFHGQPRRRMRLTAEQMLDFQRRLFKADSEGGIAAWLSLAKWYLQWRDRLSVTLEA